MAGLDRRRWFQLFSYFLSLDNTFIFTLNNRCFNQTINIQLVSGTCYTQNALSWSVLCYFSRLFNEVTRITAEKASGKMVVEIYRMAMNPSEQFVLMFICPDHLFITTSLPWLLLLHLFYTGNYAELEMFQFPMYFSWSWKVFIKNVKWIWLVIEIKEN